MEVSYNNSCNLRWHKSTENSPSFFHFLIQKHPCSCKVLISILILERSLIQQFHNGNSKIFLCEQIPSYIRPLWSGEKITVSNSRNVFPSILSSWSKNIQASKMYAAPSPFFTFSKAKQNSQAIVLKSAFSDD